LFLNQKSEFTIDPQRGCIADGHLKRTSDPIPEMPFDKTEDDKHQILSQILFPGFSHGIIHYNFNSSYHSEIRP